MVAELIASPPSLLDPQPAALASVDTDLRSLEDQMRRCTGRGNRHSRLLQGLTRLLHFLRQHVVSIGVLVLLLSAAFSAGG